MLPNNIFIFKLEATANVRHSCSVNLITISFLFQHDYSQYGIQIQVKYRTQEKLQALDRYIQSGGERAVAIAVYTLSMQHITHVPFR